jgi:hypothetical protein
MLVAEACIDISLLELLGGREAYIVPAYKTFEEIEKVLGSVERVC